MNKISACLVVHNEEACLARCLDSFSGAVDEVIIIHDGECLDKTLEIAKKYTDKIFIRPLAGFMEAHLPFAFRKASGDWLLRIDADEFLSPELKNNLRTLSEKDGISAYEFIWPFWDGRKRITKNWPFKKCFFRKNSLAFLAIPHHLPKIRGKTAKSGLALEHQPRYDNFSLKIFAAKSGRWAKFQAESYFKNFSEIDKYNLISADWPPLTKMRKIFPLLFLPTDFLFCFLKVFFSGLFSGNVVFKIAFLNGLYKAMVDYQIFIYKNKSK